MSDEVWRFYQSTARERLHRSVYDLFDGTACAHEWLLWVGIAVSLESFARIVRSWPNALVVAIAYERARVGYLE